MERPQCTCADDGEGCGYRDVDGVCLKRWGEQREAGQSGRVGRCFYPDKPCQARTRGGRCNSWACYGGATPIGGPDEPAATNRRTAHFPEAIQGMHAALRVYLDSINQSLDAILEEIRKLRGDADREGSSPRADDPCGACNTAGCGYRGQIKDAPCPFSGLRTYKPRKPRAEPEPTQTTNPDTEASTGEAGASEGVSGGELAAGRSDSVCGDCASWCPSAPGLSHRCIGGRPATRASDPARECFKGKPKSAHEEKANADIQDTPTDG
jgi:hypothetical protein